MPVENVRDAILDTLKDLGNNNFDEFRSELTDPEDMPRIRESDVEGKTRREIMKLLVTRCEEDGALKRTVKTLRAIGCNLEAQSLESKTSPQSDRTSSGVSELGSTPELHSDCTNKGPKRSQEVNKVKPKIQESPKFPPAPLEPKFAMEAQKIIKKNKTDLQTILSRDYLLILNKVYEKDLITDREYNNLKSINKQNPEEHTVELVDNIMGKGDQTCQQFLDLLETDNVIQGTFPKLKSIQLSHKSVPSAPVQETGVMDNQDYDGPRSKKTRMDETYGVNSNPRGICLILNNVNFENQNQRCGSEKDAESLAEVFSWLGFRVLMCEDQKGKEMSHVLKCFSTLSDISELHKLRLKEWSETFVDLQEPLFEHGDVFICCILSHGKKGVVCGTDGQTLPIKDITRTFKASNDSPLTGKPKVFLIQACQGGGHHRGVIETDLETDEGSLASSVPEEADVLVAAATVEDYVAIRSRTNGSWFIQSMCDQLRDGCSRGDDIHSILERVNSEVSQKEGCRQPGLLKQMPEIRYTLRKKLVLTPVTN